jgi:putative glutamine amidotransferase
MLAPYVRRCPFPDRLGLNTAAIHGRVILDIGRWSTSVTWLTLPSMRRASGSRLTDHRAVPPLIGVTTSEVRVASRLPHTPQADPPRPEMALGMSYSHAIVAAGGVPVVLPPVDVDVIEPLLAGLAGVCLSGGPDLHPAAYGAEPHPRLGPTWPDLDAYELAVARRADALGVPLLAICRGMQTLNVARGGTLHQHVDGHRQDVPCEHPTQPVHVAPGSLLGVLVGDQRLEVNSFHHQAIATVGDRLRPVAWADDGVIEAVEAPGARFVLGIQWHAEGLIAHTEQLALFTAFVDAARDRASGVHVRAA